MNRRFISSNENYIDIHYFDEKAGTYKTSELSEKDLKIEKYSMKSRPCGKCLIFNNHFDGRSRRDGTDVDKNRLKRLFKWLNFDVEVCSDFTLSKLERKLEKEATDERKLKHDCFVACFLTHGGYGHICANDGGKLKISSIKEVFNEDNCNVLKGKPKLFIFQACQGEGKHRTVERDSAEDTAIDSEMFFYQATTPETWAARDDKTGSYFIQTLCRVFEKHALFYPFSDLVLKTNRCISKQSGKYTCEDGERIDVGLMSCSSVNSLTKLLIFQPDYPYPKNGCPDLLQKIKSTMFL